MVRDAFNVVVPEGCSWCALWPRRACRMQNTQRVETETSRARESLLFRFSRAVRSRFHRTNMLRRPPATRSFDHGQHRPTGPGYIPATMHSGASNCRAGVQCIYSKPRAFFQKIGTWMAHFGKGGGQMEAYYVYGTPIHCGLQLEWWDLVNLKMPWTTLSTKRPFVQDTQIVPPSPPPPPKGFCSNRQRNRRKLPFLDG